MAGNRGSPNDDDEHDEDAGGTAESTIGVVKLTLGGFCVDKTARQIKVRIAELVMTANIAIAEAYLFANYHVSRCLSDPGCTAVDLPKLDRSFYYRCLIAVTTCNAKDDTLGEKLEQSKCAFDLLRPPNQPKADMRPFNQLMAELSIQMATMACNSVWANLDRFVFRYLKVVHPDLKRWWKKVVAAVVERPNASLESLIPPACKKAARAAAAAEQLRGWLELPSASHYNTRAHLCMRLFHRILERLVLETKDTSTADEDVGKKKLRRVRLFNLLPRKGGFTTSYIPITGRTLRALLRSGPNPIEPKLKSTGTTSDDMPIWTRFFHINAVETRKARFDGRFMTDGKGVSVQRRVVRSSPCQSESCGGFPIDCSAAECRCIRATPELDVLNVGVDPGMTDIVTTADSDHNVRSFSSARFSKDAGYVTSRHRTHRWNAETESIVASIPPSTVTSMVEIEAHVRAYLIALPKLLESRFTKGYRSMRFLRYQGKQRAIEKVCDLIAPPGRTVIVGFGNWSNNGSGIRRSCSGPIREIRQRLSRRHNVHFKNIDEKYTSCTCHGCFARLANMRADTVRVRVNKDGEVIRKEVHNNKVHKVLHCRTSVGSEPVLARCGATWNRDVNASKNILMLLECWIAGFERPKPFMKRPATVITNTVSTEAKPPQYQSQSVVAGVGPEAALSSGPA